MLKTFVRADKDLVYVNTVYFVIQARGNTRISRTAFVYNERARNCKCLLIFLSFLLENVRKKTYFYKFAFTLKHYNII